MGGLGQSFSKPISADCAGQEDDLSDDAPERHAAVLHSHQQVT